MKQDILFAEKQIKQMALIVLLVVGCACSVFGQTSSGFVSVENAGKITITGYNGTAKTVVIPDKANGMPIVAIGDSAFTGKELVSVTIGNNITAIGSYAFSGNNLTSVAIPNSVTVIGNAAFFGNKLTSVAIGNRVAAIGHQAFRDNQLASVAIPKSVTVIGDWAFMGNQLTSITLPKSVTAIGESAFFDNQLTSITIGANVRLVATDNMETFDNGFNNVYNANGSKAGIYTCTDTKTQTWDYRRFFFLWRRNIRHQ